MLECEDKTIIITHSYFFFWKQLRVNTITPNKLTKINFFDGVRGSERRGTWTCSDKFPYQAFKMLLRPKLISFVYFYLFCLRGEDEVAKVGFWN